MLRLYAYVCANPCVHLHTHTHRDTHLFDLDTDQHRRLAINSLFAGETKMKPPWRITLSVLTQYTDY